MTRKQLVAFFEKHEDDFIEFDRIAEKFSTRPDLHAFILLDRLLPGSDRDMVGGAEHDEIYLDIDVGKLLKVVSEEQLLDLHRCGVRYDDDVDSLCMFV